MFGKKGNSSNFHSDLSKSDRSHRVQTCRAINSVLIQARVMHFPQSQRVIVRRQVTFVTGRPCARQSTQRNKWRPANSSKNIFFRQRDERRRKRTSLDTRRAGPVFAAIEFVAAAFMGIHRSIKWKDYSRFS